MTRSLESPRPESRDDRTPRAALAPLLRLAACNFGVATAFYLTLSSAPSHLARLGGSVAAGAATTVSAFATAAASLVAPALIRRCGRRAVFALAALALGLPCPLLFGASLPLAELASAIRGIGLGLVFVATGGLGAVLAPAQRRGELLGLFGLSFCVPAIFAVPVGQWLEAMSREEVLAGAAMACAVAPLLALRTFPGRIPRAAASATARAPWRRLAWPLAAQIAAASTIGMMITALATVAGRDASVAVGRAMFAYGVALAAMRWWSGRLCDRLDKRALVAAGASLGLVGALLLACAGSAAALVAGAATLGVAFALQQTATLTLMLNRTEAVHADAVNASWNIAYDVGLGFGAMAFSGLVTAQGHARAVLEVAACAAFAGATARAILERGEPTADPRAPRRQSLGA